MNPEQENFDQLRRLLKLKRYEQPPPRYFNDFSSQVVARIKWDQQRGGPASREDYSTASPWLHRFWNFLQARPFVPGAFGAALCGLLVFGVVYSEQPTKPAETVLTEIAPVEPGSDRPAALFHSGGVALVSSTNPVVPLPGSLFGTVRLDAQPASQFGRPFGNN